MALKLIHHDSIHSPYYNPNATISELAERAINGSLARIQYMSKIISPPNDEDARSRLVPAIKAYGFFANISIGTPPVPQLLMIDTASNLLWGSCDPKNEYCNFKKSYLDGTSTASNLASEQATFETSDEGTVKVPIEVLGCSHVSTLPVDGQESGILGLSYGAGNLPTLVKQLGSKFSYCIGNIYDPHYQYNQLILGDGAILEGDSTTLQTDKGFYFLDLEGISVGEKKLPIDPSTFKRRALGEGGVIIDSGATFTFLKEEGYVPLRNEVESLMAGILNRAASLPKFLCYTGSMERDLTGFPVVTLLFSGGAQLSLDTNSMFFQLTTNVLCMTILSVTPAMKGVSTIGVLAQQSYNVGYDIKQGKIFFQRIDCSVLESIV
ncbi:aspartic proteinase CDR1 [Eucalyptus grandis]|uniref:aspartic proteinase CDR1 n=1 Tax=Eucalyptus grandis TaxID=71139 RepID=UPI00192EF2D5|nr:aspartic proteinase CDR1 [Eucalyptus grandis]